MRPQRLPWTPFPVSPDLLFYTNTYIGADFIGPSSGGIDRPYTATAFGFGSAALVQSPDDPSKQGAAQFVAANEDYFRTAAALTSASNFIREGAIAVWYDMTGSGGATDLTAMELGPNTNGPAYFRLGANADDGSWFLEWGTALTGVDGPQLPLSGLLGLDLREGNTQVDWYHNGKFVTTSSHATPLTLGEVAASTVKLGTSYYRAAVSGDRTKYFTGILGANAIWVKNRGASGHQFLYSLGKRHWDERTLLDNDDYRVVDRVVIEDGTDLYQFDGTEWLVSTKIQRTVDDPAATAKVQLLRRKGRYADMSPLNTEAEYAGLIDLRKRVRIDRAVVPSDHNIQGWEWEPRFEGFIDDFSINDDTIDLSLTDRAAVLSDAFVLDGRAYNYVLTKTAEAVIQQVVTDFEPALVTDGDLTRVGYKGSTASVPPVVYTEAGSIYTPNFNPSGSVFRYNDVPSGRVFDAMQAVVDQYGGTVRYVWHEGTGAERLTSYTPRRDQGLDLNSYTRGSAGDRLASMTFNEPHNLVLGSQITVTGTASHNFVGTVATVASPTRLHARYSSATIPTGTITTATVNFDFMLEIPADRVVDVQDLRSQIGSIRNHAVVKFGRTADPNFSLGLSSVGTDANKLLIITSDGIIPDLDPDNTGISFTLEGGTSGSAVLNGTYTGRLQTAGRSRRVIVSDVPCTPSTASTLYSSNLPTLKSDRYRYPMATSTSTESFQRFGLLPCAVYEGTNLSINTEAEAQRLADALVSDLALPTADWAVRMKYRPYELHDVLRFAPDPHGRWSGTLDAAVVGIDEDCASGECYVTLALRSSKPTMGAGWANRIVVGEDRPAPLDNYPIASTGQLDLAWRLRDAAKRARSFTFQRRGIDRREMGRRHDSTWVWAGTTASFAPTPDALVGKFRGDNFEITHLGDGTLINPGSRYFIKTAEQDIWGNLSSINGMSAGSAATQPSFVARFLGETASAKAVSAGSTGVFVGSSGWANIPATIDNSTDAASVSFDKFNNYSTTSWSFRMPCDGAVVCTLTCTVSGAKNDAWGMFRVLRESPSGASVQTSAPITSATLNSGQTVRNTFSVSMTATSGQYLKWQFLGQPTGVPTIDLVNCSTASVGYMEARFDLISQD